MTRLTLLTRDGCHLCDEMKAVIALVQRTHPLALTEVDISTQPDLERRFGTEIPVLLCREEVIARHKITEERLVEEILKAGTQPIEAVARVAEDGRHP